MGTKLSNVCDDCGGDLGLPYVRLTLVRSVGRGRPSWIADICMSCLPSQWREKFGLEAETVETVETVKRQQ